MTSSLLEEPSSGLPHVLLLQPSVLQDLNDEVLHYRFVLIYLVVFVKHFRHHGSAEHHA